MGLCALRVLRRLHETPGEDAQLLCAGVDAGGRAPGSGTGAGGPRETADARHSAAGRGRHPTALTKGGILQPTRRLWQRSAT